MRRWLAWCLCACACFRETDTGGVGDHGDASSSSAGTASSASSVSATTASSVTTSTSDSATTAMTEVTSDDSGTIASETTAGGCSGRYTDLGPAVAVGFAAPAEPACPGVLGTVLHTNVCCVPRST